MAVQVPRFAWLLEPRIPQEELPTLCHPPENGCDPGGDGTFFPAREPPPIRDEPRIFEGAPAIVYHVRRRDVPRIEIRSDCSLEGKSKRRMFNCRGELLSKGFDLLTFPRKREVLLADMRTDDGVGDFGDRNDVRNALQESPHERFAAHVEHRACVRGQENKGKTISRVHAGGNLGVEHADTVCFRFPGDTRCRGEDATAVHLPGEGCRVSYARRLRGHEHRPRRKTTLFGECRHMLWRATQVQCQGLLKLRAFPERFPPEMTQLQRNRRICRLADMKTQFENSKLEWCKDELRILLERLLEGNYHKSAETVFNHVAHTGVETDLNDDLKLKPTFDEFLKAE